MFRILGAVGDPLADQFLIGSSEGKLRFRRRHALVRVAADDARDELALVRLAGNYYRGNSPVARVQPHIGLSRLAVRPVALEALVGKDRTDVTIEIRSRGAQRSS